jgi:glyoxylase-like metal-dependent hydrolase (beta-lactamase superfamily II)/8-oxo-dGTP pyrophosphatase MutT (NUDIX family)
VTVTPRAAATVIVARPTEDGSYEILLTRRPATMAFMGGTYVFPGGAVDDADSAPDMAERSDIDADTALERLGEPISSDLALGLFCCALRELYEEAGVLLATQNGTAVDPAKVREIYAPHHVEVGHDPTTFAAFLASEGLTLSTDLLVPHGRLITPEQAPIRFDARFFVAPMPQGQAVIPHPTEVHEWLWISPTDALTKARTKELDIPIPTMAILQGLVETPAYEQLMEGRHERRVIEAAELTPLVTVVRAPNPGLMSGAGTNTYIVGRGGDVAVIDPAVSDPVYIERVAREVGNRGRASVVLITHSHFDHIGGVVPLVEQMPIPVAAFEDMGEPSFVTRHLADDEVVSVGGATLRALHTPGHASNHLCFYLEEEGTLFAGDVVAGFGTVVISPPDGNLGDYMRTLERLRDLGLGRIYPGHGPVIDEGGAKIDEYIAHRKDRERQVVEAMEAGLATIPEMVKQIYADVPEALHPMAERSVLSHLEMLEEEGRVVRSDDTWRLS